MTPRQTAAYEVLMLLKERYEAAQEAYTSAGEAYNDVVTAAHKEAQSLYDEAEGNARKLADKAADAVLEAYEATRKEALPDVTELGAV